MKAFFEDLERGAAAHCYCYFDPDEARRKSALTDAAAAATEELPIMLSDKPNVEEISGALAEFQKPALSGKLRVLIIPSCCKISAQGQNKLLKTLEEPPANTLVLLGAEKADLLLITVLSRAKKLWTAETDFAHDAQVIRSVLERLKSSKDVPVLSRQLPDNKAEMLTLISALEQVFVKSLTSGGADPVTLAAYSDITIWARRRLIQNVSPQAVAEGLLLKIVETAHMTRN